METSQGKLSFATGVDNSQLRTGATESKEILHGIGRVATQESGRIDNAFGKIAKAAGGVFAVGQIKAFANQVISLRGEIESLQISFNTLLSNEQKGTAMFNEIRQFAVQTPMMLKDLASGAQTMLAFNIEAEKVMPMLKAIGDVSMGDAGKFNSLTLAFSQMSATGKLMGQDLLQMINAGFNPLSVIAEKTGKTIGDLKEEMENGKITVEMVTDAFVSATSAGGKFHGMLEKQSHGIKGSISNLEGAIDDMFNGIGTATQGVTITAINTATSIAKNYEQVGRVVLGLVGTYGTYKAALITVTVCKNRAIIAEKLHYKWSLLVEKAQKQLNATMLNNPYVLIATLIAGVVAAMISMKTEAEKLREKEEEYEQQKQKVIDAEQKHKEEIEKLCSVSEDEAVSIDIRREALHKLEQKYPDIFAKYKTEIEMLEDIKRINQEIAELEGGKSITNPKNELAEVEAKINQLKTYGGWGYYKQGKWNREAKAFESVEVYSPEYKALLRKRAQLQAQVKKADTDAYFANLTGISNDELRRQIQVRKDLLAKMEMSGNDHGVITGNIPHAGKYAKEELQAQLQQLQRQQTYRDAEAKSGAEWVADLKKTYEEALKAYNDYCNGITSKDVKQEDFQRGLKERKDKLEIAKKAYDAAKPATDNEQTKNARTSEKDQNKANHAKVEVAERNEAIEAAKNAEIKATRDAQLQIDQERLNLQADSTEKSLAQIELDRRRMEAAIEDHEQGLLVKYRNIKKDEWERDNPDAKDKGLRFDRSSISMDDMKTAASEAGNEWLADALAAINTSKEIIETTAENSLHKLFDSWIEQFGTYYQRREKLTNQWELILQGLPAQYMEEAVKTMNEQLGSLQMDKIKEDLNWDDVFGNLQNMSAQAIDSMISKLRAYKGIVDETYDPKVIKEYDAAMQKLESAKRATDKGLWNVFVPQAFKDRMEAEAKLADAQGRHNELVEEQNRKEAEVAAKVQAIVAKIKEVTGVEIPVEVVTDPAKLQKTVEGITADNPMAGANLQDMVKDLGQAQGELSGITKAAGEAGQAVQGMQGAGAGIMATMAQVGAIVQKVNESVQSASKLVHDLSDTADALGADTSIGSSWDTATTIMDGFAEASEGATQAFQSLMSGNPIGVIQGIVQSFTGWIKAIAKVKDSKHERNIQQIEDQVDDLQTSYDLLGHEIDKVFGKDASALIDQQTQMLENQKKLIRMQIAEEESKKNSDDNKIKEWRNQLKELENSIADSKAAAIDAIFGEDIKSAIERLADGMADAWGEAKDGALNARDAVRTMMQQMVSESIKAAIQSSGQMDRIRQKLQEAYKDNILEPWEQRQIFDMAEQLQKELNEQFGWSKSLFDAEDEKEREASKKGIATASQESVDELNGRATAIQGHTYSIMESNKLLVSTAQSLLRSVMHIEQETDGFGNRFARVEGTLKEVNDTLGDIATKGVRLRN